MKKQLIFLMCCCWIFSLQAQDALNMTWLSNWNGNSISTSGVYYNDIWGYVDDCGNEYAIIGSPTKIHFIDVTNPTTPVFKDEFAGGATAIWRDMKTYDHYTYAVADQGNEGLMIFDMSALPGGSITKVYQENSVFTKAHNIYIDVPNARLYVVGSSSNLIVYSLANPANPTLIANRGLPGGYVHDIFVKNNIAYCSHGYSGLYVYDCTNPSNPIQKANINTGAYNHSSWLTEDGAYLIYAEEVPEGRPLGLIDMAGVNSNDLNITSTFSFPLLAPNSTNVTYHNPYIVDNYAVVSSYLDGVVIIDLSNPSNPQKVAHYDTAPNNTNYPGLDGCWGVYPYFPSGNIIASDTFDGLSVLSTSIGLTSECSDGAQSPFETGVDCGGFCKPCNSICTPPTCDDGIQNQGETAVDCGGPCTPCIEGCTNPNAHNYNANAQIDDGSCETCNDGVMNGDELAVDCGGAKCPACIPGCTNPNAHNYNANAQVEDGSCETCNDGILNGDELAVDCGGAKCPACIPGCMNPDAHNYNANAQLDDGSCETCNDGVMNGDELAIDCGGAKCAACISGCTNPDAHNYNANATLDDGSCETCEDGILNGDETEIDCGGAKCSPCGAGCTDPDAHNYDPEAVVDDGSCQTCNDGILNGDEVVVDCGGVKCTACIPGCTDPNAHNYNANAQVDDGSCETCNDGVINGDETAVDCGGTKCMACPTCDDGIQNQGEIGVDCGGPNCDPCSFDDCDTYDFTNTFINYNAGNQDGNAQVLDGGATAYLYDNVWRAVPLNYNVTANTVIEFDFKSNVEGEIHGLGFDNDLNNEPNHTLVVYGFQGYNGTFPSPDYSGSGNYEHFTIKIGDYFTGTYLYLVLITDNDEDPEGDSYFSNFQIYEDLNNNLTCDDCSSCPNCFDSIQNQGETGVDCGGPNCDPCPTCDDGIQNQGETNIDCGGPNCEACLCTNINLFIQFDQVPAENTWTIQNTNGEILLENNGQNRPQYATYSENICLFEGCYSFIINDSFNDGLCCEYGQGYYTLSDQDGNIFATGGQFENTDAVNFCIIGGCTNPDAHNYNPDADVTDNSCETCDDGILNGDEVAIDCGGAKCTPCIEGCLNPDAHNYNPNADIADNSCETCDDGILNGDEIVVDCGGAKCTPCIEGCLNPDAHNYNPNADIADNSCETCDDGILNGDETETDCGGTKCTPCQDLCPTILNLSDVIASGTTMDRVVSDYISSTEILMSGANVSYSAGNYIELEPGFETKLNGEFHAFIEGCTLPGAVSDDEVFLTINADNGNASVKYNVKEKGLLSLSIYNHTGEVTLSLVENKTVETGTYEFNFPTNSLQPGLFYVKMKIAGHEITKKLILLE